MSIVSCPLCGSSVRVPEPKPGSRGSCTKCHTPFHLNGVMKPVIGAPPDPELEVEALKQKAREAVKKVPVRRIVAGLAAALALWYAVAYLTRPDDPLKPAAERAAKAVAAGDPGYLKSVAAPDTADDVARWYEEVHARLVTQRARWANRPEVVEVGIARDDRAAREGTVAMSIHPAAATGRDVSLASVDQMTAAADAAVDTSTEWVLNRHGRWQLDGRKTLAKLHPPTVSPPGPAAPP